MYVLRRIHALGLLFSLTFLLPSLAMRRPEYPVWSPES